MTDEQNSNATAETAAEPNPAASDPTAEEKEAKALAAAEARAARANARAKKTDVDEGPKAPSPEQPRLDRLVELVKQHIDEKAVVEAFINEKDAHLPYLIIHSDHWVAAAHLLKTHEELQYNYLRNVSGIDQETHMEVAYHLLSLSSKKDCCIKVKTDRDNPSIPSITSVWATANWNEREIFDLLGVDFPGHPDLRRIMMSDDWVGHPLRKDYEALDPEV